MATKQSLDVEARTAAMQIYRELEATGLMERVNPKLEKQRQDLFIDIVSHAIHATRLEADRNWYTEIKKLDPLILSSDPCPAEAIEVFYRHIRDEAKNDGERNGRARIRRK